MTDPFADRVERLADRVVAGLAGRARSAWVEAPVGDHATLLDALRARVPDAAAVLARPDLATADECDAARDAVRRDGAGVVVVAVPGPWPDHADELRRSVVDVGRLVRHEPLDDATVEAWCRAVSDGASLADDIVVQIRDRTAGQPHVVAATLADGLEVARGPDAVSSAVGVLVAGVLDRLPAAARRALEAASVRGGSLLGVGGADQLGPLAAEAVIDGDRVVPVVADAIAAGLDPVRSAALADAILTDADDATLGALDAARALTRLPALPPPAGPVLADAARAVVDAAPQTALDWLDRASALGTSDDLVRVRALAFVGRATEALTLADRLAEAPPTGADDDRVTPRLVRAAALTHAARLRAAAEAYRAVDPDDRTGRALGELAVAPAAVAGDAPTAVDSGPAAGAGLAALAVRSFASAHRAMLVDPPVALTGLYEAADLAPAAEVTLWPDTPAVVAALLASLTGDHTHARDLLAPGTTDHPVGGAPHRHRRRLVAGWVALRAGRWADAEAVAADHDDLDLALRDRFLHAGLWLALDLRSPAVEALPQRLDATVELVRRHPVDLTSSMSHGEVVVAAARLGQPQRATSLLDQLDQLVERTAEPAPWRAHAATVRAMTGLLLDDDALLAEPRSDASPLAVAAAGLIANVDRSVIEEAAGALADDGAVYEASVLAGAAARRATRAADARALVVVARKLRSRLPARGAAEGSGIGALSERELEVARQLITGATHRQIGEALFISAKTVEHHAAHIRTKIGAGDRREMLAMLRDMLA